MIDATVQAQILTALQGLPDAAVEPPDWQEVGHFDYMYRADTVLSRSEDAERLAATMRQILGPEGDSVRVVDSPPQRPQDGTQEAQGEEQTQGQAEEPRAGAGDAVPFRAVPGLARVVFGSDRFDVPRLLDQVDAVLGAGVGRPEHVLHAAGHACSATEPEPPGPGDPVPYPVARFTGPCDRPGSGAGIRVAIVDTGLVDQADALPWMGGVLGDLDPHGPVFDGYVGHGTFVAGCLRAIAPYADVRIYRGLGRSGSGYEEPLAATVLEAIADSPDILIVTFATETRRELSLLGLDLVFERTDLADIALFAPAGNGSSDRRQWPACYPFVTSVGALAANWLDRATFSNHGPWVKVFAPGEDIVNAYATGDFVAHWADRADEVTSFEGVARWSGTSFATPLVAGLVAARASGTGETAPEATRVLLAEAWTRSLPDVGPRLTPDLPCRLFGPGRSAGCDCGCSCC